MTKQDVLEIVKARLEANKRCLAGVKTNGYFEKLIYEDETILSLLEERLTEKPKIEYIAVRSFGPSITNGTVDLENLLEDGWEFVNASDYVPGEKRGATEFAGYIEYILRREVKE
jgi:hypothetical protein